MNVIREIAEKVDISAVIERYGGVEIKRGKMFSCPFHGEDKNPSASIRKDNRWHCFTCGEGGDAIDFVSKISGVSPPDAAQVLSDDFGLGISVRPVGAEEQKKRCEEWKSWQKEKQKKEEEKERKRREQEKLIWLYDTYKKILRDWRPKTQEELDCAPPFWVEATKRIDYVEYLIQEDGLDYLLF